MGAQMRSAGILGHLLGYSAPVIQMSESGNDGDEVPTGAERG